jgi:two-component SAPR family response regulator
MPQANIFGGRRILVVEDDYLIVADLVQELEASGAHVIGPIPTLEMALEKLEQMPDIAGAILDINLHGEMVFPLAEDLQRRNIPFVFASAYERKVIPAEWRDVPLVQKPADLDEIAGVLLRQHAA